MSTVGLVDRLVKVMARNDVDQDVHFQHATGPETTLCGMTSAGTPVERDVTCYRCHQFAIGDI